MKGEIRLATGMAAAVTLSADEGASGRQSFDVDLTTEIGKLVAEEFKLCAPAGERPIVVGPLAASVCSSGGLIDRHASASSVAASDGDDGATLKAGRGSLHPTNEQYQLSAEAADVVLDIAGHRMEEQPTGHALVRPGHRGRMDARDPAG
jgi:hypothetical protein